MEYTVQKLSKLAGISTRTLRYYDEIGLLKPARINSSGYRIYGKFEVDKLQQVLFYRELGVSLENISQIINAPSFDIVKALREHRAKLLGKKEQIDLLIANIDQSIAYKEGSISMKDNEKFEGFKEQIIEENEKKYGNEVRSKYGNEALERSNSKLKNMSEEQYSEVEKLSNEVIQTLIEAMTTGDPAGEIAQKAADLHRQWLCNFWDKYTKEAHAGLAQMYVADERFAAFYDEKKAGATLFLRDAILIYTGMK